MTDLKGKAIIGLGSDKKCLYCIMRLICFKIVAYERAVWKDRKPAARTQFILS